MIFRVVTLTLDMQIITIKAVFGGNAFFLMNQCIYIGILVFYCYNFFMSALFCLNTEVSYFSADVSMSAILYGMVLVHLISHGPRTALNIYEIFIVNI